MSVFVPSTDDPSTAFLVVEFRDYATGHARQAMFLVDASLVSALETLGQWHPRVSQSAEKFSPVLRRRDPRTGTSREVRLPIAVVALTESDDPVRLASQIEEFLDTIATVSIMRLPRNRHQQDCRYKNWKELASQPKALDDMRRELSLEEQREAIEGLKISPVDPEKQKQMLADVEKWKAQNFPKTSPEGDSVDRIFAAGRPVSDSDGKEKK